MKTVLITGAGGFLGRHLCPMMAARWRVVGADLAGVKPVCEIDWRIVERRDGLSQLVCELNPDLVVHLAFCGRRRLDLTPDQYVGAVLQVDLPFFAVMAERGTRLLLISSAAVYGNAGGGGPIDETCRMRPVSLYGLAKAFQEMAAHYYIVHGLGLCVARLFNLSGPGQMPGMLLPDWVMQTRAIADGKASELRVQHMETSRDFVDVRDAARAIVLLGHNGKIGEVFNVASGEAVSLRSVGEELKNLCPVPFEIVEEGCVASNEDVLIQRGSFAKISTECGWRPLIHWRQSLKDLWDSYA